MAPFGLKFTVAMALVLAGTANPSPANAQQKIMIDGSTGTAPLVEALGKAFTAKHSVGVELGKGLGTKERFDALSAGKIDVAMASHGLKVSDITAMGMTVHRIALTPVVFAVHESVLMAWPTLRSARSTRRRSATGKISEAPISPSLR